MSVRPQPLFKRRVLQKIIRAERDRGVVVPEAAKSRIAHWIGQLERGVFQRMTESSVEQTFNHEIFGTVLGYEQIGTVIEASLMPKRTGPSGKDTPDFVIGRFDLTAGVEDWKAVGEIKGAKTDLDQPQIGRANQETPVEQAFRYATKGRAGVEWILVSNFVEIRLYKNGYTGAYHSWRLNELSNPERLFEFYILLRPEGLIDRGREPIANRAFQDSISAGRDLTEGFYGLYKDVQQAVVSELLKQAGSKSLTSVEVYGKAHKLLNRILFIAFCQQHPAELLPRNTLRQVADKAKRDGSPGSYWKAYKELFRALNKGGGLNGLSLNAFNGGLFADDVYLNSIQIPNALFMRRFRSGKGRRLSLEITGIFGFDVYDFGEDLNVQALGAIFEQSLKDIEAGLAPVRGAGEIAVTVQQKGGVYYTPREITNYIVGAAFDLAFESLADRAEALPVRSAKAAKPRRNGDKSSKAQYFVNYSDQLKTLKVLDPACGSGAFLVEALDQLQTEYDKVNRATSELSGKGKQLSLLDLDRLILRENLHGTDILDESVEITKLSIWLRTAKRGEKLETLDTTIEQGDSLRSSSHGIYDVVIGNPPWGAALQGWQVGELASRFPSAGSEVDSYALFTIRSWEMLKSNGVLAFIVPNSWLTVSGYSSFREWFLQSFEIVEITNVWKVFADVNHDACILIARKRAKAVTLSASKSAEGSKQFVVKAVERGKSESEKLRRLASSLWSIEHKTSHSFQYKQPQHRLEVIYPEKVAEELDAVAARCRRLDSIADVTVGIQVYHHTKVSKQIIQRKGFHSTTREGADWHPYIDANDVQRYYSKPTTTQWLHYNDRLRDKRELSHYRQPRILIQQIFWRRVAAILEKPSKPTMYLNTLFAIYNSPEVSLECLLGLLNSRFVSGSYERRANRLFGDKFPKVSKIDLASIPIPHMSAVTDRAIGDLAVKLQEDWQLLRDTLREAEEDLVSANSEARLSEFGDFWTLSEQKFQALFSSRYGSVSATASQRIKRSYAKAKSIVDERWHVIRSNEEKMESFVRKAYRVDAYVYETMLERTPIPSIEWALRS